MTICRSVSMQTAHHSVSNVVALPSLPPPQHPLLAVASLCQQASWTAPSEQVPVIGDGESEKLVSYPPKCISDGESTVITQTADPSKQCSAGVQTQIDSDTSANGFSPACFGSPTLPGCDERERNSGLFWAGSTKEPAATQTDSQTDSRTDSPTTGPPRAERFLTPLVVEADSIGECLTSPVPQISSSNEECSAETTIVPDKPNELDLSGLELLYKSIEHMESMETKRTPHGEALAQDDDKVLAAAPNPEPSGLGGLGLLCALAEQRIQEELEDAPRRPEPDRGAPTPTPRPTADVNRNYRTPQSEKDVRRYLATRAEASHASPVAVSLKLTPKNDSVEMEIQNRLAELKRAYKETQRELSRLTPRKNSTECESSCGSHNGSPHSKRVPAKSSLTRKKKAAAKKKTPHKSENSSDPPPPILERVTDVCEAPLPKLKWSRLDAPPTLTPHKPPSEHSNGQRASFKLNLVKLPATKDHKRRWSVDSPSARISTETQHADDEDSDGLWPEFSSKHFEARHRRNKGPSDTSSLYSSSKRRKVGRPKRHLDKAGNGYHATETIVPKQPKNKANLVSFLLASKSAGAPGKFPSNEHRPSENSCSSPEHRPKIRPKLKAEVKVKETWEDEDILDWSTPKPQLPSHPLRPLDLVFECMEEISSNGHEKSLDLKRRVGHEDDIGDAEWLPSPKKAKMPATLLKPIVVPSFIQSKISEKTLPIVKPRRPANVAKERRQSTEKLHLKKPVCSSSEELMPAKVSCDPESCILTAEILDSAGLPIRTLTAQGGLFYAGLLNAVTPPDLYSIALHGERASRLNIYSREEILQDTILEVRPLNVETLHIGTRLCAYWSQQTRCLYPGVVVPPSTPDPTLDGDFVTVEFDDGDSGQIRIQDIRLLPPNYPVVEFDPNPLLSLTKRRRRNSEKSSDSKDRRVSADSALSPSTSNHENQKEDDVKNLSQAESSDNLADAKQPFELSAPSTFRNSPSPYKRRLSTQLIENESKRLKKRRRDKLKRLMTASAAADARKHKHKHKHKHRHRRSSSGSSSDAVSQTEMDVHLPLEEKNRSDPIQEPLSPISGKGEIKQLKEEEEEEKEVLKEEGKKDEYVSKEEELQEDVKMESCDPQTTIKESQPTDLPKSEDTSILANESQSQGKRPKKKHDRQNSTETSKMAAFLPPRQLWDWSGKGYKRQGGKGRKKEFYKCIQRGSEQITVGDCAVFLSTNSPDRPYIGRIESLWEIYNGMMVVRVKWFYHPEETEGCPSLKYPGGLFQSDHADDNDVQTISHRCEVLSISDYEKRVNQSPGHLAQIQDVYYLAGFYDPKNILIKMEKGVPV